MMARTYRALAALLSYPTEALQAATGEIAAVLAQEAIVPAPQRADIGALLDWIATTDIYALQERYFALFDRSRSLSLHLFEHVHGESRDRGQAMIDLKAQYERHGLFISAAELPDFLPLFLEYLSVLPLPEAGELLGQPAHILDALAERLRRRKSPYEAVLRALTALAAAKPDAACVTQALEEPDQDPSDLAALDAAWEDEPVSFGPTASSSCKDGLIARIRAGRRRPPPVEA